MADRAGRRQPVLDSVRAPRVRAARRLTKRAFRERARLFLAEGPQAVKAALQRPRVATELFVTLAARDRYGSLAEQAAAAGLDVHMVSADVMAELAQTVTPQGVLAVCRFVDVPLAELVGSGPPLVAVLASVRDPGNAGTVLRTADAAGVAGVIFTATSVDPYNGKCVRATAGSLFRVPVVVGVRPEDAVAKLRAAGLRILAADGSAETSLYATDLGLTGPTAWLFGNEAWGLSPAVRALADTTVAVPIYGGAESLNLAAAAAVCLYATAVAQRG